MGEIGDGEIRDSEEENYLFESNPKGDLFGNEQDFHLLASSKRSDSSLMSLTMRFAGQCFG